MTEQQIPEGFSKIINDLVRDILITFPEYTNIVKKWWNLEDNSEKLNNEALIFKHCFKVFPERFFDILNKNNEIFEDSSDVNTEFLPGIVFKYLWKCDISDKTRDTIWKYLQLILFSVISTVQNPGELGDTAKLFENMDEDLLKSKLAETLEGMQSMFENSQTEEGDQKSNIPEPSAEDIHAHLNGMMKGKLGKLAMEFAEETAQEMNLDMNDVKSSKDVFQNMFKNPGKLMNVVKNIGSKLDSKIKSGELSETEIITEGMEILNNMKNVPGMENMQNMFAQMGLGKNAKMNVSAMEAQMQKNLKMAQMKERMKKKAETKTNPDNVGKTQEEPQKDALTDEQLTSMFNSSEPEKQKSKKKKSKK